MPPKTPIRDLLLGIEEEDLQKQGGQQQPPPQDTGASRIQRLVSSIESEDASRPRPIEQRTSLIYDEAGKPLQWEEAKKSPYYQMLDDAARAKVREAYGVGPAPVNRERGLLGDIGTSIGRSAVNVVSQLGGALELADLNPSNKSGVLDKLGRGMRNWARTKLYTSEALRPDISEAQGKEGTIKKTARGAIESLGGSLAPVIPGAAIGLAVGGPAGAVIGSAIGLASLFGLFGAGTYADKFNQNINQLVLKNPEEAKKNPQKIIQQAHKNAMVYAGAETLTELGSDVIDLLTFKAGRFFTKPLQSTIKELLGAAGKKQALKEFGKEYLKASLAEVPMENLNYYLEAKADAALKIGNEPTLKGIAETTLTTLWMTLMMGAAFHRLDAARKRQVLNQLQSPDVNERIQGIMQTGQLINEATEDKEFAKNWVKEALKITERGGEIPVNQKLIDLAGVKFQMDRPKKRRELAAENLSDAELGEVLTRSDLQQYYGVEPEDVLQILNQRKYDLDYVYQKERLKGGGPLSGVAAMAKAQAAQREQWESEKALREAEAQANKWWRENKGLLPGQVDETQFDLTTPEGRQAYINALYGVEPQQQPEPTTPEGRQAIIDQIWKSQPEPELPGTPQEPTRKPRRPLTAQERERIISEQMPEYSVKRALAGSLEREFDLSTPEGRQAYINTLLPQEKKEQPQAKTTKEKPQEQAAGEQEKEPWELTPNAYAAKAKDQDERAVLLSAHPGHVKKAYKEGKTIPTEVLKAYSKNAWARKILGERGIQEEKPAAISKGAKEISRNTGVLEKIPAKRIDDIGRKLDRAKDQETKDKLAAALAFMVVPGIRTQDAAETGYYINEARNGQITKEELQKHIKSRYAENRVAADFVPPKTKEEAETILQRLKKYEKLNTASSEWLLGAKLYRKHLEKILPNLPSKQESKEEGGPIWRGGPPSAMPKGKTALDVVKYETEELGNNIKKLVDDKTLANIPTKQLQWVSSTREAAERFGPAREVKGVKYRVLAKDPDGGMLVEILGQKEEPESDKGSRGRIRSHGPHGEEEVKQGISNQGGGSTPAATNRVVQKQGQEEGGQEADKLKEIEARLAKGEEVRVGKVRVSIREMEDNPGFYYVRRVESGIAIENGGGPYSLWTKEKALEEAKKEIGFEVNFPADKKSEKKTEPAKRQKQAPKYSFKEVKPEIPKGSLAGTLPSPGSRNYTNETVVDPKTNEPFDEFYSNGEKLIVKEGLPKPILRRIEKIEGQLKEYSNATVRNKNALKIFNLFKKEAPNYPDALFVGYSPDKRGLIFVNPKTKEIQVLNYRNAYWLQYAKQHKDVVFKIAKSEGFTTPFIFLVEKGKLRASFAPAALYDENLTFESLPKSTRDEIEAGTFKSPLQLQAQTEKKEAPETGKTQRRPEKKKPEKGTSENPYTQEEIEALTFDTIQDYEETAGVGKNRGVTYRTAEFIGIDPEGKQRHYTVKISSKGTKNIKKGRIDEEWVSREYERKYQEVPSEIREFIETHWPNLTAFNKKRIADVLNPNVKTSYSQYKSVAIPLGGNQYRDVTLRLFPDIQNDRNLYNALEKKGQELFQKQEQANTEAKKEPSPEYGASNKVFTADAAEKAREILRKKLGQISTGIDPELMQAGITLAGFHFEAGARKAIDFARAMVNDVGEKIIPYLRGLYENIRYYPGLDTSGISKPEEAAAFFDELSKNPEVLQEAPKEEPQRQAPPPKWFPKKAKEKIEFYDDEREDEGAIIVTLKEEWKFNRDPMATERVLGFDTHKEALQAVQEAVPVKEDEVIDKWPKIEAKVMVEETGTPMTFKTDAGKYIMDLKDENDRINKLLAEQLDKFIGCIGK